MVFTDEYEIQDDLRLNKDEEEEYSRGMVFDNQVPEERTQFSNYLIIPTKFNFQSMVRIHVPMSSAQPSLRRSTRCRRRVSYSAGTGYWIVSTTPLLLSCMMMGVMGKECPGGE